MKIDWKTHQATNPFTPIAVEQPEYNVHCVESNETSDKTIKTVIEASIEKAISLLAESINDNSCYMLFEWDEDNASLSIVVSDAKKAHDSPQMVKCCFKALSENMPSDYAENIHFWIRDYLTTCAGFMRYSLVAAFHTGNRNACTLL